MIVERYLDTKHYQYDLEEIYEMCEYNSSAKFDARESSRQRMGPIHSSVN